MQHNFRYAPLWLLTLFLFGINTTFAGENPDKFSRQRLFSKSVALPSKEVKTEVIRVVFSPGYKSPLHTHEGPGPRYVVKGKVSVVDSGNSRTYAAGEVFWETGSAMTIENVGSEKAEIIIFQLSPANGDN